MKYLKKFNESSEFDKYHSISEEDIKDCALEMTDNGFSITIKKCFLGDNGKTKTNNPISKNSIPMYEVSFERNEDESDDKRWDGGIYYGDLDILKLFTSTVNKMKSTLPAEHVYFNVNGRRYTIRVLLNEISLDKVGFDFGTFHNKLYAFCQLFENGRRNDDGTIVTEMMGGVNIESFGGGGNSLYFEMITNGVYKSDEYKMQIFKNVDSFDNRDQYDNIISSIEEYISQYKEFVDYRLDLSLLRREKFSIKDGLFKKKEKIYAIYYLNGTVHLKGKGN